jgi:hypothetical protein
MNLDPALDPVRGDTGNEELRAGDHAVLLLRESREFFLHRPV